MCYSCCESVFAWGHDIPLSAGVKKRTMSVSRVEAKARRDDIF